MSRRPWTDRQLAQAASAMQGGLGSAAAARLVGRSPSAVRMAMTRLRRRGGGYPKGQALGAVHRRKARALGWPEADTALEARALGCLLSGGPQTERQLAAGLGLAVTRWQCEALRRPMRHLRALGQVVLSGKGPRGANVYALAPWLLARKADEREVGR